MPNGNEQQAFIPDCTATYLSKPYWDERFAQEESYEWCKSFDDFCHLLRPHFSQHQAVLELGAGNSSLSSRLALDLKATHICSLDISQVVAGRMQAQQLAQGLQIEWQIADMLQLPFRSHSLDIVIEKGALDVFLVDRKSPWDPAPQAAARMRQALQEVHRVLINGGKFLSITFDQPHFRKPFLLALDLTWDVSVETFGDGLQYFVYTMCKGSRTAIDPSSTHKGEAQQSFLSDSMEHEHMNNEDYLLNIEV